MNTLAETLPLTEEDQARAGLYALLARLLHAAPDAALLETIAQADELAAGSELAKFWLALQKASAVMDAEAATQEYEQVFIGLGQGEVMPYLSWHLTGFLMEEPLAKLRDDLAVLGLTKASGVGEPEDHMAALCEVMRLLVVGDADSAPVSIEQQRVFFDRYLRPWYKKFVAQLEAAPSANYYRAVARLLRAFLDVEAQAFEMGAC
jgi:TorA maturation chaperone TorD